jgi:ATP-dependent Lhr-like helicase
MDEAAIKYALKKTWIPFFSRFGRLTPVQISAIPPIIEGENLVVISPAATGKTEAVVAPVVERLIADRPRFSVLYISPTRALVNDLFRRLAPAFEYLHLPLDRKTGDRPSFDEDKPPFMLLTTPESFDSLLCRHPKVFLGLRAVIVDEVHLLDRTPRGDQMRILLERLRLINKNIKFYLLSATIDDLFIGERYFSDPKVVVVKVEREIDYTLLPHVRSRGEEGFINQLFAEIQNRDLRKILVFFNARSFAESYSRLLDRPPFSGKVWVHHASLPKQERENAERLMNCEKSGILCATSTLELGIDIGDIDGVVLFRPPFNVSSLLQRIGRGNRRKNNYLFAIGVYENNWEKMLFEIFFDCARHGLLFEHRYQPSLSTLPQQIVSYLYQRRRIGATFDSLLRVLVPVYNDENHLRLLLQTLIDNRIIKELERGVYFLSSQLEKKIDYGKIHSNIQEKSFGEYEVFDAASHTRIGRIFYLRRQFILGGRCWELVEVKEKERRAFVRLVKSLGATTKIFEGTGTPGYSHQMAVEIKKRIFPELGPEEFPCFSDGGFVTIVHLLGSLNGFILSAACEKEGMKIMDVEGKIFLWERETMPEKFPLPTTKNIKEVIGENIGRLVDNLGSGAFFNLLPRELQIEDHFLSLNMPDLFKFLERATLAEISAEACFARLGEYVAKS